MTGLVIRAAASLFGVSLSPFIAGLIVSTLVMSALGIGAAYVYNAGESNGDAKGFIRGEKHGRDQGYRQALADIVAKKQEALDAARKLRSIADACVDSGGVFRSSVLPNGLCERP
jgi:hypothetical protein